MLCYCCYLFAFAAETIRKSCYPRTPINNLGAEHRFACTLDDILLGVPLNSFLIITALRHIHRHTRLRVTFSLHKDNLDGVVASDVLKGIRLHRADALAVNFDVGDSIARIRSNREGLISALVYMDTFGRRDGAAHVGAGVDDIVAINHAAAAALCGNLGGFFITAAGANMLLLTFVR